MPCLSVDVQNTLDQACTGCESTILDNREEVHDFVVRLTLINSLEILTEDACATVVDIFYNKKMIESVRFPSTHCAADYHHLSDAALRDIFGQIICDNLEPSLKQMNYARSEMHFEMALKCAVVVLESMSARDVRTEIVMLNYS